MGSPTKRTLSAASTGASEPARRFCPVWPGMSVVSLASGRSLAVSTQTTPGSARALLTSSRWMRAEGWLLRNTLPWSMWGIA